MVLIVRPGRYAEIVKKPALSRLLVIRRLSVGIVLPCRSWSYLPEAIGVYARLLQNSPQGTFGHITWMVWDCGIPVCDWIVPDLVAASGMSVKHETK